MLKCATRREKLYETPPDLDYASTGLTPGIRMALGQLIKDRKPLSPEWALAWALGDDRISRPKPVWNCPKPFRLLFLHHFSREHPRGIPLPGSKTQIGFYYRPFSAELKNPWCQPDLPDVIRLTAPLLTPRRKISASSARPTSSVGNASRRFCINTYISKKNIFKCNKSRAR